MMKNSPQLNFTICHARDEDVSEMMALRKNTIQYINAHDYESEVIEAWGNRINARKYSPSDPTLECLVAKDHEKILGFCEFKTSGEIWRLYIHKDFQRQGIGSALMKSAEEYLQNIGCQQITLESTITAKEFYLSLGYVITEEKMLTEEGVESLVYVMKKGLSG